MRSETPHLVLLYKREHYLNGIDITVDVEIEPVKDQNTLDKTWYLTTTLVELVLHTTGSKLWCGFPFQDSIWARKEKLTKWVQLQEMPSHFNPITRENRTPTIHQ